MQLYGSMKLFKEILTPGTVISLVVLSFTGSIFLHRKVIRNTISSYDDDADR